METIDKIKAYFNEVNLNKEDPSTKNFQIVQSLVKRSRKTNPSLLRFDLMETSTRIASFMT